jgi:hypothetical protein
LLTVEFDDDAVTFVDRPSDVAPMWAVVGVQVFDAELYENCCDPLPGPPL